MTAEMDHMALEDRPQQHGQTVRHWSVCNKMMPYTASIKSAHETMSSIVRDYSHRALAAEKNEGVDWKAVSHAVRIATQAIELLETGNVVFPRPDGVPLHPDRLSDRFQELTEEIGLRRIRLHDLRHGQASIEDVDYRVPRKLDKALFQQLATCRWIVEHRNLLVTGPCGIGKSWLACALAQKACRDGYSVHYARVPRLFADLELAHGDGRFAKLFRTLTKADLLILDDWGPYRLSANHRRDLMEIVEDRYGSGSTLITSQLPVDAWHEVIGEPTFADAILDRLVHNAYRHTLDGPSIRKIKAGEMDAAEGTPPPDAANGAATAKPTKAAKK